MKKRVLSVFISTVLFVSTFCIQVNATESMEPDQISVFEDGDSDETYTEDEFSEEIPVEEDLGISEENTEIIFGDTENISDDVIPFEEEDGIWLDGEVVDENTDSDIDIIPEIEENPFNDAQAAADAEFWCGHFYKVYDTPMTPSAASAYCESMGGYLATFTSNSERSFLIDLVKSKSDYEDWYWIQSNTGAPQRGQLSWSNGEYSYYIDPLDGNGTSKWAGNGDGDGYHEFRYYALRYKSYQTGQNYYPFLWLFKDFTSEDADPHGFICEWGDYIDISDADISLSKTETVFNGNIQSVNVTAVYGGVTLEENRDYTYEISRNINVGRAAVTVRGRGRFCGEKTLTFDIVPQAVSTWSASETIACSEDENSFQNHMIEVEWTPVSQASNYEIEVSTSSSFERNKTVSFMERESGVIQLDNTSDILQSKNVFLYKGQTCYVRMRAVAEIDDLVFNSAWTAAKSITLKKFTTQDLWKFVNPPEKTGLDYYTRVFDKAQALSFYAGNFNKSGLCYGMTILGATYWLNNMPQKTYLGIESINKYDWSRLANIGSPVNLQDLIRYAHVIQYDPELQKIITETNKNDLDGLVNAVEAYQKSGSAIVSASIRHNKKGHRIMFLGIKQELADRVVLSVYDCNSPETERELIVYKSGSTYSGWRYQIPITNEVPWGSQNNGDEIAWDTRSSSVVYSAIQKIIAGQSKIFDNNGSLIAVKNSTDKVAHAEKSLKKSFGSDLVRIESDNSLDDSNNDMVQYWVSGTQNKTVRDIPANTEITISAPLHSATVTTTAESDITFNISNAKSKTLSIDMFEEGGYSIRLLDAVSDSDTVETIQIDGISSAQKPVSVNQSNDNVLISGTKKATIESAKGDLNENGEIRRPVGDTTTVRLDEQSQYQVTGTTDLIVNGSTNNDNVYDQVVIPVIDLSKTIISLSRSSYNYTGSMIKPAVKVVYDGKTLSSGTDYTVSYVNNINAGTASVKITGKGNYEGTVTKSFTINRINNVITASNYTKSTSASQNVSFTLNVKRNANAKLSFKSNTKYVTVDAAGKVTIKRKYVGKATITITAAATQNYNAVAKKILIKVIPSKSALTGVKNSDSGKMTVRWKRNTTGTGYYIQYSTDKNFKKSVVKKRINKNTILSVDFKGLKKGKTYYVRICTYKKVSGTNYYSNWSAVKKVKISAKS